VQSNVQRNMVIIVQNLAVPFDRRVWQEATSLQRAGFGVAVICPRKGIHTQGYEKLEGVDIYRYPLIYEANAGVVGYLFEFVYCWLISLLFAVKVYLQRPFHAIHACNPPDTYFALAGLFRLVGVKFVFDHHDLSPEMYLAKGRPSDGVLYRGLLWLERQSLRSADLVVAVNRSHFAMAVERGGIPGERVAIVRSGPRRAWADVNDFSPNLKQGRKHMVMYLGEMCEQDGVDYFLRAARHYQEANGPDDNLFAFIGGGPHQPRMRDMADEMGLAGIVHFTGRVSDEILKAYLSTADVCVDPDPLTAWSDLSTMNKMIEYLAFGRPVVAFSLREHRHTAGDCSVFVPPNDELAMSTAIRDLLLDEGRRANLSESGRKRFREVLAWENSEKELIERYSKLLDFAPGLRDRVSSAAEA
jgi:glycosyltransferase involved in cell wall biosynthesis